jgi:hypothetical protein
VSDYLLNLFSEKMPLTVIFYLLPLMYPTIAAVDVEVCTLFNLLDI